MPVPVGRGLPSVQDERPRNDRRERPRESDTRGTESQRECALAPEPPRRHSREREPARQVRSERQHHNDGEESDERVREWQGDEAQPEEYDAGLHDGARVEPVQQPAVRRAQDSRHHREPE